MLRRCAVLLLLAGCLDEPAAPPGHGYEMRDQVLVADLDGDGFDDLVTWGHDGDPRVDSQVFVRWGGQLPLHADADVTKSIPGHGGGPFHETVTVMHSTLATPQLLALECEGQAPGSPNAQRDCQLYKLSITGKTIGDPVPLFTHQFVAENFGGWTRAPAPIYLAEYEATAGDPRMIVGDHDRVLEGPLGGDIADVMYTAPDPTEKPQAAFSVPPSNASMPVKFLFVTSVHAGLYDAPPIDAGSGDTLFDHGDPTFVATRDIGGPCFVIGPVGSADLTYMHTFNGFMLEANEVKLDVAPEQLALGYIGGSSFVYMDAGGLHVEENLDPNAGTFTGKLGPVADENETVLAVGKFDSDPNQYDSIMLFDATDKTHAPLCYHVVGGALVSC